MVVLKHWLPASTLLIVASSLVAHSLTPAQEFTPSVPVFGNANAELFGNANAELFGNANAEPSVAPSAQE
jgi:hypothetical protein